MQPQKETQIQHKLLKKKSLIHFIFFENITFKLKLKVLAVNFIKPLLHERAWLLIKLAAKKLSKMIAFLPNIKNIFIHKLRHFFIYLRFRFFSFLPRWRPTIDKRHLGISLIGCPPISGLGFTLQSIFNSVSSLIPTDILYTWPAIDEKLVTREKKKGNINIIIGNPDSLLSALFSLYLFLRYARQLYSDYNVGFYFWEFENAPKHWASIKQWTDEIWVQSDFMLNTFKKISPNVYKVPFSLDVKPNNKKTRNYFNLPNNKFIFLFTFDFWSCYERKNPEAVVRAFKKAFGKRKGVYLLIKTTHGENLIPEMNQLVSVIGDAPNIELRNVFISGEDQYSLINQCDAYISLHRSEGLGLGMAEAMYLKKPVIATNYSGNLEFMNKKNSCLVDCSLVPHEGTVTYQNSIGQLWAEPDCNHAAYFMKKIKDNSVFRDKISSQAASDMKKYNAENFQKAILSRINRING